MSRRLVRPDFVPMIAMAEKTARALRADMIVNARKRGFSEAQPSHNAVFATLPPEGARAADMANRAGITRQSMGEAIRDLVDLGIVEMVPDPDDGRAKIVRFTRRGVTIAQGGFDYLVELDNLFRTTFGENDVDATYRVLGGIMDMFDAGLEPAQPGSSRR